MIESFLSALGLTKASLIAGAIGAAAAAMRGDGVRKGVRVFNFTVGFFVAAWGSGVAISLFGVADTPTFHGAFGFTLGYLGMTLTDKVVETVQSLDLKAIINSWLGRRDP